MIRREPVCAVVSGGMLTVATNGDPPETSSLPTRETAPAATAPLPSRYGPCELVVGVRWDPETVTTPRSFAARWDVVGPWRMHAIQSRPPVTTRPQHVVVVHGLGLSSRYLLPTLELLAERHVVHAPDLPGCGRSSRSDRPLDQAELGEAVVGWMDAVGIDRAVLVGHSIGCQVVAHAAERHPDRASSVVLASPTGDPTTRRWRQAALLLAGAAREAPALVPLAVRDYLRAGPLRMWRTFGLARTGDVIERVQGLPQPCLVVRGSHDAVVSDDWTRTVVDAARAGLMVTIPEAPHGLPYSAAPQLTRVIDQFLARAPGPGR